MGKMSGSGFGINNPDHISDSLETIFWVKILKFFDADPGWKKFGSATLADTDLALSRGPGQK
jgi:hypothetical protein